MPTPFYLAGQRITNTETLDVHFPFNDEVIGTVCMAQPEHVEQAIVAAQKALPQTSALEPYQKVAILEYIVQELTAQHEAFAQLLTQENGKTINEARGEMTRCIATFANARGEAERMYGEYLAAGTTPAAAGRHMITKRFPIGIVSGITPFNFPMNLMAHKVAPALAAGCPIIIKPASATPLSTLKFAEIVEKSGRPLGAFSVLPCTRQVGQQLVTDERIALLSFTGSPHVGWKMKQDAGKKKTVLELGGNAWVIIDKDITNRDYMIQRCVMGAFYQAGQSCISVQRILVHETNKEKFEKDFIAAVQKIVIGDPRDEKTTIWWLIDQANCDRLSWWIQDAIGAGATLLSGNTTQGTLLTPTVLSNVPKTTPLATQEAFGPVVLLDTRSTITEAVDKINDSTFGLQVGVFSDNLDHIRYTFDHAHVGGVIHGDVPSRRVDHMPYGGVKDSWQGREGVKYAMEDMTELRLLVLNPKR